jgi:hypothetical protein
MNHAIISIVNLLMKPMVTRHELPVRRAKATLIFTSTTSSTGTHQPPTSHVWPEQKHVPTGCIPVPNRNC